MGSSTKDLGACLLQLKELIRDSENKHLQAVIDKDDYLTTFIIGRKYNVKYAFETAKGLMAVKHGKFKQIFDLPSESVRHVLESGFFGTLKHRDEHGRRIAFMRIAKLDIKTMEFDEIMRTAILLLDHYWYDHSTAESGQIFIMDYTGYNFAIFTRYSFNQKLNFLQLFLNNYPSKVKGAHLLNNPKLVGMTYSLIRPLLPEKLKKRIFLHGHDRDNLLQHFDPNILPKWMGGNLTDEEAIDTLPH